MSPETRTNNSPSVNEETAQRIDDGLSGQRRPIATPPSCQAAESSMCQPVELLHSARGSFVHDIVREDLIVLKQTLRTEITSHCNSESLPPPAFVNQEVFHARRPTHIPALHIPLPRQSALLHCTYGSGLCLPLHHIGHLFTQSSRASIFCNMNSSPHLCVSSDPSSWDT